MKFRLESPWKCTAIFIIIKVITLPYVAIASSPNYPIRPEDLLPELAQILATADENAPRLIEENFLRRESDARLQQARSNYYPSLDLGANLGFRKQLRSGDAEDTDNLGLNYNARLRRPLYHWGAIEARIEQARIDNEAKAISYLQNTQRIRRDLRSSYLTLLLNQVALKNETIRKDLLENEFKRLEVNFKAGNISELSYRTKELDLKNSLLQISRIERDQKRIIQRFKSTAGWDAPLQPKVDIPEVPLDSLESWINGEATVKEQSWTAQNHTAQLTQLEIRDREEALTVIQSRQRPLLNFTASASQNQSNTSTQNNVDTLTLFAGLSINWNIFDGFETKHRKIEANLERRRLEARLDRIKQQLNEEKQQMIDAIQFQIDNTRILETRYLLEQRNFNNSKAELESGRSSVNELRDSERSLIQLELDLASARADLMMHISDYLDLTKPNQAF